MNPPVLPCTRLLFLDGTDHSPWPATPTKVGLGAYIANAQATALGGPERSLDLRAELTPEDAGVLLDHGTDVGARAFRLRVELGVVHASDESGELAELEVPGLVPALAHEVLVRWASEPNLAGQGPQDAVRSRLHVYNVTTKEHARVDFLHAVAPAEPGGTLSLGGVWLGGQLSEPLDVALTVRIGATFQTGTAMREHWLGPPIVQLPPVGISRLERPRMPEGLALEAEFAGPGYTLGARSLRANSHRPVARVVAGAVPEPTVHRVDLAKVYPAPWVFTTANGWAGSLAWTWRRRVPLQCNLLVVWIRATLWSVSEEPPSTLHVRACSSDRPPGWTAEPGEAAATIHAVELVLDAAGEVDRAFPGLAVVRGEGDHTWLWFEFKLEPGEHTRYSLAGWAWTATRDADEADLILTLGD